MKNSKFETIQCPGQDGQQGRASRYNLITARILLVLVFCAGILMGCTAAEDPFNPDNPLQNLLLLNCEIYNACDDPVPVLWYKADALVGYANGNSVPTWPDSGTMGINLMSSPPLPATPAPVPTQPIYLNNAINGKPVLRFTTAGQNGLRSTVFTTPIPQPITVFMVYQRTGPGAGVFFAGLDGSVQIAYLFNGTNSVIGAAPNKNLQYGDVGANKWGIAYALYNNTNSILDMNAGGGISGSVGTMGIESFQLGFNYTGSPGTPQLYVNADIAEIMIFSGAITGGTRRRTECYLSKKYNIPITGGC